MCILWKVTMRYELGRKHRKLLSPPSPRLVNVDGYMFIPADLCFPKLLQQHLDHDDGGGEPAQHIESLRYIRNQGSFGDYLQAGKLSYSQAKAVSILCQVFWQSRPSRKWSARAESPGDEEGRAGVQMARLTSICKARNHL